jgi:hypothetical protein
MQQKRRERLEKALASLEAEFRTRLILALKRCEGGAWGLFGQNNYMKEHFYACSGAQELDALGAEIAQIREELGIAEPFSLHAQLLEKRGRKSENDLGEARLAADWLKELDA